MHCASVLAVVIAGSHTQPFLGSTYLARCLPPLSLFERRRVPSEPWFGDRLAGRRAHGPCCLDLSASTTREASIFCTLHTAPHRDKSLWQPPPSTVSAREQQQHLTRPTWPEKQQLARWPGWPPSDRPPSTSPSRSWRTSATQSATSSNGSTSTWLTSLRKVDSKFTRALRLSSVC